MSERYVRVVSLWIHPGQKEAFEAFERDAAGIMARHGGQIDIAVRLATRGGEWPFEMHVVSFPDQTAAESYAADPESVGLRRRRSAIIARTEVFEGRFVEPYRPQ